MNIDKIQTILALGDLLDILRDLSALVEIVGPAPFEHYWLDDDHNLLHETVPYTPDDTLAEASTLSGAATYSKIIRGIARQVWQGKQLDAFSLMWDTVTDGMTAAWSQGAATCGISPDDFTLEERVRRDSLINEQRGHIFLFLEWVNTHRRDGPNKKLWRQILPRTNTWGNAFNKSFNEGQARACANQPLRWVLHGRRITKKPCKDCLKLNDRIYRASIWAKNRIFPQSFDLACSGFNCGCMFVAAPGAKLNKGKPPKLAKQ